MGCRYVTIGMKNLVPARLMEGFCIGMRDLYYGGIRRFHTVPTYLNG